MEGINTLAGYAVLAYLFLAITKIVIVLEKACLAAAVSKRISHSDTPILVFVLVFAVISIVVSFLKVIPTLRKEKLRFFVVYTAREVMRELINAEKAKRAHQ